MATTKARQDLRSKFVRNAIPTEQDFKDLIDAQLNQKDDGIFRNPGEPLSIVAGTDPQKRTLLLYSDDTGVAPDWLISLNPGKSGLGIATGDGNLLLFIDRSGKIGIGTNEPKAGLEIHKGATNDTALRLTSSGPGWGSGLQLSNTAPGEKTYGIFSGLGGSLHIADVDNSVDRLVITGSGSIGIGKSPNDRLDVDGRIRAGALTIGPWPASPLNYAFIGSNLQDQTNDGNYALLVGTGAEVGTTYLNGSASIGLRIGNAQRATVNGQGIAVNGNLKITGNSEIDGNFKTTGNGDINGSLTIGTTTSVLVRIGVPNPPGAGTIRVGDWLLRTNGSVFEIVHAPPRITLIGAQTPDKIVARFDASQAGAGRLSFP